MEIKSTDSYIELTGNFKVLSSAPLNGGLTSTNRIVNHTTSPEQEGPIEDYFKDQLSLSESELEDVVGFLTAVDVRTAFTGERSVDRGKIVVALTAGVNDSPEKSNPHTINVLLYTDLDLSLTGMANLFIVVTEAKASALRKLEVLSERELITGTATDAIAVAKPDTGQPGEIDFTGTGTDTGKAVYDLVETGITEAIKKNNGYEPDRNILTRLSERGITREQIVSTGFALLVGEKEDEQLRAKFISTLEKYSRDPNIHFLIAAGFYLEDEKERFDLKGDPGQLVADELLGMNIAEYIGGKNAMFNFFRYDSKKPGILENLPPFLDDVIGGLVAGCMTEIFEE